VPLQQYVLFRALAINYLIRVERKRGSSTLFDSSPQISLWTNP